MKEAFMQLKSEQKVQKFAQMLMWRHENIRWCWKLYGGVEKLQR